MWVHKGLKWIYEGLKWIKEQIAGPFDEEAKAPANLDELRDELTRRININRKRLNQARFLKRLCLLAVGVGIALVPIIFVEWGTTTTTPSLVILAYVLGLLVWSFYFRIHEVDRRMDIQDAEGERDLISIRDDNSREQRAEKLFKLHQLELKRYYDQTLNHSSRIFGVGIMCLLLGFVIVGGTIYYLVHPYTNLAGTPEKVALATLGAIGGVLSNFIAAIYLKMHTNTISSLTDFHRRLVTTHHLHFGYFLTAKITDDTKREDSLAHIARRLVQAEEELAQGQQANNGQNASDNS